MNRDDTNVTVNHSEFDTFKGDVRDAFKKIEEKLDQLLHPETGIHSRIASLESRLKAAERSLDIYRAVAWRLLAPAISAMGIGLLYLLVMGMPK